MINPLIRRSAIAACTALFLVACDEEPTTPPLESAPLFRGNGGGTGKPDGGGNDFVLVDVSLPSPSDAAARVVSDGRGIYVDGACGVAAQADGRNARDGSMILNPDETRIKRQEEVSCGTTNPRFIEHRFVDLESGPGVPETVQAFNILVVRAILDIPVGTTADRNVTLNDAKCGALSFNGADGSQQASVTRQDENTWLVSTTLGFCRNEGSLWSMPFSATITKQ